MNLWPFGNKAPKQDTKIDDKMASVIIPQWQDGKPLYRGTDFEAQLQANTKWIYRCVQVIADAATSVPFRVYVMETPGSKVRLYKKRYVKGKEKDALVGSSKRIENVVRKQNGELVEIEDHPVIDLLEKVNPHMNGSDLDKLTWSYERLTGNAYWYKVRDSMGIPVRIWPLHTPNVSVIPSRETFIKGYEYKVGTTRTFFDESEVIHFKDPNPADPFYGKSPLSAMVDTATLQRYMDKFDVDLFYNQAVPQTVLTTDQPLNQATVDRVKSGWRELFGFRSGNTGNVAIMDAGLKPHQLTMSHQDLHYEAGQERIKKEVFGIYGVPITKADTSEVRANTEAGDIQFLSDTILPLLRRKEQKLNEKLLPDFDERLFGAYDNPVPSDREFALREEDTRIKNGTLTRNEARNERGEEPLPPEQGDVVPPFAGTLPQGGVVNEDAVKALSRQIVARLYRGNV